MIGTDTNIREIRITSLDEYVVLRFDRDNADPLVFAMPPGAARNIAREIIVTADRIDSREGQSKIQ